METKKKIRRGEPEGGEHFERIIYRMKPREREQGRRREAFPLRSEAPRGEESEDTKGSGTWAEYEKKSD